MKKSNFKIDEMLLVLIVAILALAVGIYDKLNKPKWEEAEKISEILVDGHSISIARGGIVDEQKLTEIENMDYQDLKKTLKVKSDFCIYLEDEEGGIFLMKGSSKLNEDGLYCNE